MSEFDELFEGIIEPTDEKIDNEEITEEVVEKAEEPMEKSEKKTRSNKMVYKITNKTFQPIQLVISENEMLLLGARKKDNVVYIKNLTKQVSNLQNKGLIKIRKMS